MMEKTWRWFGKKDKITLPMLRQIGVEGIVTALHDIPNGEIWTIEAINALKSYIESYGLRWSVVESLPVCEAIKYGGTEREQLIENYKVSLTNLGKCGIKTVCYNFMPVIDWIRTDLQYLCPDGTSSLYYDRIRFAYFDMKILEREGAEKDYTEEELHKVSELDQVITEKEKDDLIDTIIVKTQGFVNGNIKEGDKITITAELSAGLEVDGYYLKENSTVVTVENIDRYLSDQMEPGMWEQIEPYCDQEITDELNGTFFIMDGEDSYRFDKDDVLSFEGITYGTEAYLATCRAADGREAYNMLLVPYLSLIHI